MIWIIDMNITGRCRWLYRQIVEKSSGWSELITVFKLMNMVIMLHCKPKVKHHNAPFVVKFKNNACRSDINLIYTLFCLLLSMITGLLWGHVYPKLWLGGWFMITEFPFELSVWIHLGNKNRSSSIFVIFKFLYYFFYFFLKSSLSEKFTQ